MKCSSCAAVIPDDSKFCPACGQRPQAPGEAACPACGAPAASGQRFCAKCGGQLAQASTPVGSPVPSPPVQAAGPSVPPPVPPAVRPDAGTAALQPAGVLLRFLDGLIDAVALYLVAYIFALLVGQTTKDGFNLHGLPGLIWWLFVAAYYIWFEGKIGATPGKLALGLRVVKTDGTPCDMKAAAIRTVCRIVDHFFLIGLIIIAASKRNQRLGDRVADTLVIKTRAIKFSRMKSGQFGNFDD